MNTILEVTDLKTQFTTPEGIVYAVNGISFQLNEEKPWQLLVKVDVVKRSACYPSWD